MRSMEGTISPDPCSMALVLVNQAVAVSTAEISHQNKRTSSQVIEVILQYVATHPEVHSLHSLKRVQTNA